MSIWTHVCGCIRVDGFRIKNCQEKNDVEKIKSILGQIVSFEDYGSDTTLPCGSEGSLKYEIYVNPDVSSVASYVVSIFGDLRDYDDMDEIETWFREVCGKLWVRNAVIHIYVCEGVERTIAI